LIGRIGAFVCDCKGLVSDHLDTEKVAAAAASLEGVSFADRDDFLCGERELGRAIRRLRDQGCDRMLFVGCSPRSSLKFPEERIARVMQGLGLSPDLFEVANIREQCAWQHTDREAATAKAIDLLRMAHVRLVDDEAAPAPVPIPRHALVVGGGPAGLQVARDLAAANVDVTLVEQGCWLGGKMCQLHKIFQSEAWPSVCDAACVGRIQAKDAVLDDGVRVLTSAEVDAVERRSGGFHVTIQCAPQYVDPDRCISCHECATVCPEELPRSFDQGMSMRKAIDKEFERALPDLYTIAADACTMCGDCVPVCPTGAIDLAAKPRAVEGEYGAVFLATGASSLDLSGYEEYAADHADVITSMDFERLLERGVKRPSDGHDAQRVVFVQCAGSRASPDRNTGGVSYCSRTCCSVTAKQVERLSMLDPMAEPTIVTYRDMRTYERALEALYQRLRAMGHEFVNGDLSSIEPDEDGGLKVVVDPIASDDDEDEAEPIEIEADLVVLAAAQTPATKSDDLYRKFGVVTDRYGYPIETQPRLFRPTESLVDRVFVVGACAGPKVVQQACEQGSAAAMRALPALLEGAARPPRHASRVDPARCTRCGTCVAVCPHGAIRMTEEGAISDPAFCQACGLCGAACPVHAADLTSFTDRQILAQAEQAFRELAPGEPRILALLCYWCAYSAADFAGIERSEAPANYRAIRIRCSSSVNTGLLMEMFKLGVDGILVGGCPERSCHHLRGNFLADKRLELARALMRQMGLDPGRLRFEYIGAPMQAHLVETLYKMDKLLRSLSPNPVAAMWAELSGSPTSGRPAKEAER